MQGEHGHKPDFDWHFDFGWSPKYKESLTGFTYNLWIQLWTFDFCPMLILTSTKFWQRLVLAFMTQSPTGDLFFFLCCSGLTKVWYSQSLDHWLYSSSEYECRGMAEARAVAFCLVLGITVMGPVLYLRTLFIFLPSNRKLLFLRISGSEEG